VFKVLGITEKEFFEQMGVHFVSFVGPYGYDRVLSVLGRHMRDFLDGIKPILIKNVLLFNHIPNNFQRSFAS